MNSIIKFGILFVVASLILSFFGSYLTVAFDSMSGTLSLITNQYGIGLVLTSIWSFLSFAFDLIFLNSSISYTNSVMSSTIQIGSISWALTFFRVLFGCTIIVFIISLIFGGKHD